MNPDVLYPVRRGHYNDELRYSLRSLSNVPHGNVILSGFIPNWATNVIAVNREQDRSWSHWANVRANIAAALSHLSDPFYLFNDDFYIMEPMDSIPVMHAGPFKAMIERYRRTKHTGAYWRGMVATELLLQEWGFKDSLSYELHLPMLMYKAHVTKALEIGSGIEALSLRSVIGNVGYMGGEQKEDCKVMARAGVLDYHQWPFLSSSDDLPYSGVGTLLSTIFPVYSTYEVG
jgi:hypothetical protein